MDQAWAWPEISCPIDSQRNSFFVVVKGENHKVGMGEGGERGIKGAKGSLFDRKLNVENPEGGREMIFF